jgi:ATP-binding cassette subfamily F protein 3
MIDFINIQKSFADKDIIKNGSLRINDGERVGLVGPNGAGKSTIFNIIIGSEEPDKGEVKLPKKATLGYLKQQILDSEIKTPLLDYVADALPELKEIHNQIIENEKLLEKDSSESLLNELGSLQTKYESLGGYVLRAKAEKALFGLGFTSSNINNPISSFSGGWQMRAELAKTLIVEPDILLLDEPSNYLDIPAIEWMQKFLKSFSGTLLLISHDRFLLNTLTNITIEINAGLLTKYAGNYDYYIRERENRFQSLLSAKENQDKKREQLQSSINRFKAKSTKASQVQSWIKMLDRMEEIHIPGSINYSGSIKIPNPPPSGAEIVSLDNVTFSYDGKRDIIKDLSLRVDKGDKIAIIGYNGMGKTTLLKIIADVLKTNEGKRTLGHKVIIGYQSQDFSETLPLEKSIHNIISNAAPHGTTEKEVRNVLAMFGFTGDAVEKQCKVLSGGEKIKLAFAKIFISPPNFLILDEPTTHLDISAREALQKAIKQYSGTVCLVSHDIEFISNTAETILEMNGKGGVTKYHGGYEYYLDKKGDISTADKTANDSESDKDSKTTTLNPKEERKRKAQLRQNAQKSKKAFENEVKKLEKQLESLESKKEEIMTELADTSKKVNYAELNKDLKETNQKIDEITDLWETKAEELEEFLEEYNKI